MKNHFQNLNSRTNREYKLDLQGYPYTNALLASGALAKLVWGAVKIVVEKITTELNK
jgi:hypothetical protein